MESEEYMNRKSRKQRGEVEVSILITLVILVIVREEQQNQKRLEAGGLTYSEHMALRLHFYISTSIMSI